MTPTASLRLMALCVAGLAGWTAGQPRSGEADAARYHRAVKSRTAAPGEPHDFQARIDVTGTPFVRDTMLLYSCQCGKFPFNGPQEALPAVNPTWMDEHLAQIAKHLDQFVPDVGFSGLIVIDYEDWDLLWDRTDEKFREAWIAYAGPKSEYVHRAQYEAAARTFYQATFERVKELRPAAQVGFFTYPAKFYLRASETSPGVIGYGDGQYAASDRNGTLGWLWEMEDFLAPNVYCLLESVEDPDAGLFQNTPAKDIEYVRSNTAEALRLARGKPVYDLISYEYQRSGDNRLFRVLLNAVNMAHQLRTPLSTGVTGVILWGRVETAERATELSEYLNGTILPLIRRSPDSLPPACRADIDGDGGLDLFDFLAFVNLHNAGDAKADFDDDGVLTLFDFLAYTNAFNAGC
jgi:hypothetical protein